MFTELADALKVKIQQNKKSIKKEETPETLIEKSKMEEEKKEEGKNRDLDVNEDKIIDTSGTAKNVDPKEDVVMLYF